jgi:hypothetical protein
MGSLAKDNEYHKVVDQHMNDVLRSLLSSHFYLIYLMEPTNNHSNIDYLYNKPKQKYQIISILKQKLQTSNPFGSRNSILDTAR